MRVLIVFFLIQIGFIWPASAQVEVKCSKALEQSVYPINEAREVFSNAPFEFSCELQNNQNYSQNIKSIEFGNADCKEIEIPNSNFLNRVSLRTIAKGKKYNVRIVCKYANGIGPFKNDFKVLTTGKKSSFMFTQDEVITSKGKIEAKLSHPELNSLQLDGPQSCTSVDLFKKGGTMEFIPPTFQLTGNCFAQQASQLYDAYRFRNGTNNQKLSSPADIALTYWSRADNRDFNGGLASLALDYIMADGTCPRQFFNPQDKANNYLRKFDKDEVLLSSIESITSKYKKLMNLSKGSKLKIHMKNFNCEMKNLSQNYSGFSNYNRKNIADLENILDFTSKEKNSVSLTMKLMKDDDIELCQNSEKLKSNKPYKIKQYTTSSPRQSLLNPNKKIDSKQIEFLQAINKEFNKGSKQAQPFGVSICSNVFNTGTGCGGHAMVLTGRRFNQATKKCEYKLRSHWPDNCKASLYKNVSECNNKTGEIWTDASSFLPAVDKIIQVVDK